MNGSVDYWLGQLLSLVFYLMTIIVYNRAKKEYVGGKIAAAINLIMVCLAILLITDFVDYFLLKLVPLKTDIATILKILLKLTAICVLFFGGLRFFSSRSRAADMDQDKDLLVGIETDIPAPSIHEISQDSGETAIIEELSQKKTPRLGRYEILERIGKGAMGIVYKGRDPKLNRLTAIKTIRFVDEFDEDKVGQIKAQFYREAEVVAKLSHKNIVMLYDVGEDLDLSYLAMEYLEGESLEQFTSRDHLLPLNQCVGYLTQVCEALHYAHSQGVVHRDIKPGNIMILKDSLAKVMDFGIARAAGGTKTRTGIIKGTPFYMSPEQAKGGDITGASDIFALGVLFYQLLTGKLPFTGENLATIMYQTANEAPEPVTAIKPDLDPAIVSVLDKALEKDPGMRFASAGDMAKALRKAVGKWETGDQDPQSDALHTGISGSGEQDLLTESDQQETINLTDLEQVLMTDSVSPGDKGLASDDTGKTPVVDSPADTNLFVEDDESRKGFNLTELREIMAAGRLRDDEAQPQQVDSADMKALQRVSGIQADNGKEIISTDSFHQDLDEPDLVQATPYQRVKEIKKLPGYAFPLAYGIITLILLAWSYYFFWHSPNADNRLFKLVYHKYFEPVDQKKEKIIEEQKRLVQQIMKQKLAEKQRLAQEQVQLKEEQKEKIAVQEEKKNEQMALALQKIEAQKKLEAERETSLAQEKQREAERLRRVEEEKKQAAERLARAAEEKQRSLEKQLQLERERREAVLQSDITRVKAIVATADALRQKQAYLNAKKEYTAALTAIEQSAHRDNARLMKQKIDIQGKLLQDDMVYGPRGYVLHKDVWMSPDEYEATRYKEGYVKYKGKFRDHRTLRKLIRSKTESLVDSHVMSKYGDETIHKKDIKYQRIDLKSNTSKKSSYLIDYIWEIWLFKGIEEGACSIEIAYDVARDKWEIVQGCE